MASDYKYKLTDDITANAGQTSSIAVDPSKITTSFYQNPTNADNYEGGRPVYQKSQALVDAAAALTAKEGAKPAAYQSQYGDQIQGLIDGILNRSNFNYDVNSDPMYQLYSDQYTRNGELAARSAQGDAAAQTGGYGNSYATTLGQQTNQGYLDQLNDKIPELRDAAYNMYKTEGQNMRDNLGMLQTQEEANYGKYRDTVTDYQQELDYIYNKYTDMTAQEYEYYKNDAAAWQADRGYWYQKEYDEQQQENWEREFAAKYGGKKRK